MPSYDVRDYGAVGDGVADDGPAVNRALAAAASAGGGTVVAPLGKTFRIATPIVIPGRMLSIRGAG